jgi:hypothetical protein
MSKKYVKEDNSPIILPMASLFFVAYLLAVFFTPIKFNFGLFCTMLVVAALVDMFGIAISYFKVNRNG